MLQSQATAALPWRLASTVSLAHWCGLWMQCRQSRRRMQAAVVVPPCWQRCAPLLRHWLAAAAAVHRGAGPAASSTTARTNSLQHGLLLQRRGQHHARRQLAVDAHPAVAAAARHTDVEQAPWPHHRHRAEHNKEIGFVASMSVQPRGDGGRKGAHTVPLSLCIRV